MTSIEGLEHLFYRNQNIPYPQSHFQRHKGKYIIVGSLALTAAIIYGTGAVAAFGLPALSSYFGMGSHETCNPTDYWEVNQATLTTQPYVLVGNDVPKMKGVLKCFQQPNSFSVDISDAAKPETLNTFQEKDDFLKFANSKVASSIMKIPADPNFNWNGRKTKNGLETHFVNPNILVTSLCQNFPEDASREDTIKLASTVQSLTQSHCSISGNCATGVGTEFSPEKFSTGKTGALQILDVAKQIDPELKNNDALTNDPMSQLLQMAEYIKRQTGDTLNLKLDASGLTTNAQKLADFALTHEIRSNSMDTRSLLLQYAFPNQPELKLPLDNQKIFRQYIN